MMKVGNTPVLPSLKMPMDLIEKVAAQMVTEKVVRIDRAEEILKEVQKS